MLHTAGELKSAFKPAAKISGDRTSARYDHMAPEIPPPLRTDSAEVYKIQALPFCRNQTLTTATCPGCLQRVARHQNSWKCDNTVQFFYTFMNTRALQLYLLLYLLLPTSFCIAPSLHSCAEIFQCPTRDSSCPVVLCNQDQSSAHSKVGEHFLF